MNFLRRRAVMRRLEKKTAAPVDETTEFRQLTTDEITRTVAAEKTAALSRLAIHLARTKRDEAIRDLRLIVTDRNKPPTIERLLEATARMNAAIDFEDSWLGLWEMREERK